jgi:hypothetical protein
MDKEKPVRKGHSLRTGFLLSAGFVPLRLTFPRKNHFPDLPLPKEIVTLQVPSPLRGEGQGEGDKSLSSYRRGLQ